MPIFTKSIKKDEQQLDRYLYPFPKLEIRKRNQRIEEFCFQDFNLQGYVSNTTLAFPLIV